MFVVLRRGFSPTTFFTPSTHFTRVLTVTHPHLRCTPTRRLFSSFRYRNFSNSTSSEPQSEEASSSSDDPSPPPPKSWWERLCDTVPDSWATYCNYIGLAYPVIHSYNYWRRRTLLDELEAYDRETYPTIDTADTADLKKYLFEVAAILGLNERLKGLQRDRKRENIQSISPEIVAEHLHPTLRSACEKIHTALMDRNRDVEELEARLQAFVVEQLVLANLEEMIVTMKIAQEQLNRVVEKASKWGLMGEQRLLQPQ